MFGLVIKRVNGPPSRSSWTLGKGVQNFRKFTTPEFLSKPISTLDFQWGRSRPPVPPLDPPMIIVLGNMI